MDRPLPATNPNNFFGDPSVRLTTVVGKVLSNSTGNICDPTTYASALQQVGAKIKDKLQPSCLTSPFTDATKPDCFVAEVTTVKGVDVPKTRSPTKDPCAICNATLLPAGGCQAN